MPEAADTPDGQRSPILRHDARCESLFVLRMFADRSCQIALRSLGLWEASGVNEKFPDVTQPLEPRETTEAPVCVSLRIWV